MTTITGIQDTATGPVTVTAEIDFDVPKAGDTLNIYGHEYTLKKDMRLGVDITYNEELGKYEGVPKRTTDGKNNLVFYGDRFSWRKGEYYKKNS
ncbi:MAG: hypothetical protein ACYSR9_03560 [Planctomycetota bacterium]